MAYKKKENQQIAFYVHFCDGRSVFPYKMCEFIYSFLIRNTLFLPGEAGTGPASSVYILKQN